ncbi:Protein of unknown function [Rhizobium mongolense subsp. loessense]|uniref:Fusaric acid resistance family protein n=1 Tax=Rhizobium mongolense subsp. loessense TaxID=158890 RepID=A0A1G4S2R6_9HYPH|nr:DUF2955 domain-containing protein [Rhizobium mongolense]SCW63523.1 Protein of unknown function [Rhizobium mongolense subsp. loessense]
MSSEASAIYLSGTDRAVEGLRRAALRLAFGVAACFTVVEALDWEATFLAPLLAANMLAKLERPSPSLAQGLTVIVLIAASTGIVLVLTTAFMSNPTVLILTLALLVYVSFYAHRRGVPELATLLPQISAVMLPTIAILSPATAGSVAASIVMAGIVALMGVWAAHAIFPVPVVAEPEALPAAGTTRAADPATAARHALCDTLILLPVLTWFILDATQVSIVVLIVIVTLLRLPDRGQGQQAALGLILGNLIGGTAAAGFYNLVLVGGSLLFFITAFFAASLIFAGRIAVAADRAPVYAIAFATFILLVGLGMSPLPGTSGEAFVSRLLNVLLASAYAIGGLSLMERWRHLPS